jgi:molecular chaperone GrpE
MQPALENGVSQDMTDTTETPPSEPTAAPDQASQMAEAFAVIEKLNAENAELKDRLLRTLADVENMRRRSEREAQDARSYAVTAFARDLLNVADNLHRALENIPAEARVAAEGALKALVEGVELTSRELHTILGRHGVKKLEPEGEKFDPNFHQAMFEVPDETVPAGTVTQVMQAGWKIAERVLRPAMVGVSKGGPKPAPKVEKEE